MVKSCYMKEVRPGYLSSALVFTVQVKPEDIRMETLKDEAGNNVPHVLGSGHMKRHASVTLRRAWCRKMC